MKRLIPILPTKKSASFLPIFTAVVMENVAADEPEISLEEYRTIGSYHIKRGPITLGDSNKERLK